MINVFIGSSTESLDIAKAIQANFSFYDLNVKIWSQGFFTPSSFPIESLLNVLESYDFGIFVFAPDDTLKFRNQELSAVRDNVIFEMGLFVGKLGKERTFFVIPHSNDSKEPLRLPSDIWGLQPATYNAKNTDKRAALGVACEEIRVAIEKIGPKFKLPEPLPHFVNKSKEVNDSQVYFYTFFGLQAEKDLSIQRNSIIGLNSVYHTWADPTDQENYMKATVILDQEPNCYRINFKNAPGCYPADVTIRPCGLYPMINTSQKTCLAFDARAIPLKEDHSNRCSTEIGLSFRLYDGLATAWNKGITDPIQEVLPVDGNWRTFHIDLTKDWFLFSADGNYYYPISKDKLNFSIISGLAIEFGSKGGPRLGAGYGQVEITNIRLCDGPN